jgi:hypothetical protein
MISVSSFLRVFIPSELILKTPVESVAIPELLNSGWDDHLPKVVNLRVEEDVSSLSESEYERDQVPDNQTFDEPNHDPCEDDEEFKFDKTGARVDKSFKDPYKKFVEGVDVCVSDDCVCSPHSSFSPPSPPSIPSFSFSDIPPNLPYSSPFKKTSSSSSSSSVLSKFSNVFSCCQVGPPKKDIDLLCRFSQKVLNPPLVIGDDFKIVPNSSLASETQVSSENNLPKNKIVMDEMSASPSKKSLKSRKVKRDDEALEAEIFKRSVICDGDEDSDEKRRTNLKRESIEFGPCSSFPYKSRKVFSSKTSTKSVLSNSKVIAKHLAKSIPKPPNSLPVGFIAISKVFSELIEGDQFNDVNKTVVTYVLDVFKCLDGYMSSQIYKEVIKIPGWSIPIAILCALVFTIIINSYWTAYFNVSFIKTNSQ